MANELVSIVLLFFLGLYIYLVFSKNTTNITEKSDEVRINSKTLAMVNRTDCQQVVTYCFQDSHCRAQCLNSTGSVCRNGICLSGNILNTTAPVNECNASKGVVTFFVGNVALGRYNTLCRSIDPGIASNDIRIPNRMCLGGNIDIDYTKGFPAIGDCMCNSGEMKVRVDGTRSVRPYVVCLESSLANRIL